MGTRGGVHAGWCLGLGLPHTEGLHWGQAPVLGDGKEGVASALVLPCTVSWGAVAPHTEGWVYIICRSTLGLLSAVAPGLTV